MARALLQKGAKMMADSAEINSAAALQVFSAALAIRFRDEKLRMMPRSASCWR